MPSGTSMEASQNCRLCNRSSIAPLLPFSPLHSCLILEGKYNTDVQGGLLVRLLKAEDLPPADSSGLSDPYVIFKIDGREQRSTVKPQTLECSWDEKFEWMKVCVMSINDTAQVRLPIRSRQI